MLDMRPNCECCDKDLPADAAGAMICSFECTFCEVCSRGKLRMVCPNCGGALAARPVRPTVKLVENPGSAKRVKIKAC